ncbi:transcriptional regulator [Streptomyces sp. NPDC002730]|uniref:transcriptional regulator n=1 Tax=Streptomyces sp. NPDC002730 TaxID=3364662 RepID=UPI0036BD07DE
MRAAVSPMLVRLADERATGVLVRDHGALYLADGQVVHAESPDAPGLDVLLTARGRLEPGSWADAVARAGSRGEVARFLVDSGQVAGGELEICHLGALFDAAFFALAPASGPTRFRYGVVHWIGRVRPVPTRVVEREAQRRSRLLDSVWPYPAVDTAPLVRCPHTAGRAVGPRRQSLLDLADGVRTPAVVARELGRPAFNTLIEVRRLAAEGLIATPAESSAPGGPAAIPESAAPSEPAALPETAAPRERAAFRDTAEPPSVLDSALLRRLRDALEANL